MQGATAAGRVTHALVGAERAYALTGRGLQAETLFVRVPSWAKHAQVDVQLTPELWDEFTDFSVTVYDSTGEQLPGGNEAVNYAFGRLSLGLPEKFAGQRLTVEFYPAFAKLPGHAWGGSARIRFLGKERPLGNDGDLSVVAGGRAGVPLPIAPSSAIDLPEGFSQLIETRVGAVAVRRTMGAR